MFEDLRPAPPEFPPWLDASVTDTWRAPDTRVSYRLVSGVPVAFLREASAAHLRGTLAGHDADSDAIPDALDILLGAKKAVLNAADYRSSYRNLSYPGGDVPRTEGVCSDVVVRALRNAGYDLQALVHEDIARAPKRYPHVRKADSNIDHRRVRVLVPWFEQHWQELPLSAETSSSVHLPGDVVFFDTLRGPEPDHVGIISDQVGSSGSPLVINNWTEGYETDAMDLLPSIRVTHRFRIPTAALPVENAQRGLSGLLHREGLPLAADTRQVVLVTAPTWTHSAATLRRYERADGEASWNLVGPPIDVRIGGNGLGRGLGKHAPAWREHSVSKREGDRRAPAGMFTFGTAFGPERSAPTGTRWPWRQALPGDVFVDDPKSSFYNSWQHRGPGAGWASAEDLTMYELGLVVEHNTPIPTPDAGSAIFLHTSDLSRATLGCTALRRHDLENLLIWLAPEKHPLLIQTPGHVYD